MRIVVSNFLSFTNSTKIDLKISYLLVQVQRCREILDYQGECVIIMWRPDVACCQCVVFVLIVVWAILRVIGWSGHFVLRSSRKIRGKRRLDKYIIQCVRRLRPLYYFFRGIIRNEPPPVTSLLNCYLRLFSTTHQVGQQAKPQKPMEKKAAHTA